MLHVNVCRFDCHRAVEENWKRLHSAGAKHFAKQQREKLCAADCERWHKHFAAAIDCIDDDALEFRNSFFKRTMIAAAISLFEKNKIGLLERFELAQYRSAARPEIAGENDALRFAIFVND